MALTVLALMSDEASDARMQFLKACLNFTKHLAHVFRAVCLDSEVYKFYSEIFTIVQEADGRGKSFLSNFRYGQPLRFGKFKFEAVLKKIRFYCCFSVVAIEQQFDNARVPSERVKVREEGGQACDRLSRSRLGYRGAPVLNLAFKLSRLNALALPKYQCRHGCGDDRQHARDQRLVEPQKLENTHRLSPAMTRQFSAAVVRAQNLCGRAA